MEQRIRITILSGDKAIRLFQSDDFILGWKRLSQIDKKTTILQEPGFVVPWYSCYAEVYCPVFCLGYNETEQLIGLMLLARHRKTGVIAHAGDQQAEYHGWLSYPEFDTFFPVECLIALKKRYCLRKWQWRYVPPDAPTQWFFSPRLVKHGIFNRYQKEDSPVWDLSDPTRLNKLMKNRAIRTKFNYFEKQGTVRFERIMDKDQTRRLMDVLGSQCDFRQGAAHNAIPFANDSHKAKFYIERQNYPEANHFSVLWVNDKILATHFGAADKKTAYLGLTSFDPTQSRKSPGSLLMVKLAERLHEDGYRYLDMTPGGDQYKRRFSNTVQTLYRPTFYFNKREKIKADVVDGLLSLMKRVMLLAGIEKHQFPEVRYFLSDLLALAKKSSIIETARALAFLAYEKRMSVYYRLEKDSPGFEETDKGELQTQKYEHLMLYEGTWPWISRRVLISSAQNMFVQGETLYSCVQDGKLIYFGWRSMHRKEHRLSGGNGVFESAQESILIHDFYLDPQVEEGGRLKQYLNRMVADSFKAGAKEVYAAVYQNQAEISSALRKMGFPHSFRHTENRFLGIVNKRDRFSRVQA